MLLIVVLLTSTASARRRLTTSAAVLVGAALTWVLLRTLLTYGFAEPPEQLVYAAWAAVPLVVLAVMTSLVLPDRRLATWMERGFMFAAGFALVQFVFGIERTAVPGLTIAWGDSYASKHNVIYSESGDFSKIMSTYQSGNIFGVIAAMFVLVAAVRLVWGQVARTHDVVLLIAGSISVVLAGSRTGLLMAFVGSVCIVVARGSLRRKMLLGLAVVAAGGLALAAQPALASRYRLSSVIATGGSGRTDAWAAASSAMSPLDWVAGMRDVIAVDGAVGLVTAHGLVGITLTGAAIWVLLGGDRSEWRVVWFGLAAAAFADSTFRYFPTWFIPALAAALAIRGDDAPRSSDLADRGGDDARPPRPDPPTATPARLPDVRSGR